MLRHRLFQVRLLLEAISHLSHDHFLVWRVHYLRLLPPIYLEETSDLGYWQSPVDLGLDILEPT